MWSTALMPRIVPVLLVLMAALPSWAEVSVTRKDDRISVEIDGAPFTSLIVEGKDLRKPYFHPLRTASGKIVTRRYPMETVAGESTDHPHHRGLSFAHGDVNGVDFWASDPSRPAEHDGRIELNEVRDLHSGAQEGSLTVLLDWKDPRGKVILTELRTVTFRSAPGQRIMDLDIRLTGVEDAHFGDTKEGTLSIRVADSMNEEHGGTLVNASGVKGEKRTWGKRSPWMDYYGQVEGETVGIAILDHPENLKHPPFWHVRAYGLFAVNIFGEHDFFDDKDRDGGMTLKAGSTWRFRYRVVIHSGDAEKAGVGRLYEYYAGK